MHVTAKVATVSDGQDGAALDTDDYGRIAVALVNAGEPVAVGQEVSGWLIGESHGISKLIEADFQPHAR